MAQSLQIIPTLVQLVIVPAKFVVPAKPYPDIRLVVYRNGASPRLAYHRPGIRRFAGRKFRSAGLDPGAFRQVFLDRGDFRYFGRRRCLDFGGFLGRGLYLLGGSVDFAGVAVGCRCFGVGGAVVAVTVVVEVMTVVVAREDAFTVG